jgi:hypothetical protein
MEALFKHKIPKILEKHEISTTDIDLISKQLAYHTYTMVFNICALIATHTLVHDKENRKILPEHIKASLAYVIKKCYPGKKDKKKGGTEDTYGSIALYEEMRNAEIANHIKTGGGISVFTVIFTKVTPEKELFPSRFLHEIFNHFEVVISDSTLKHLKHVLKMILSCLLADLKKSGDELTPKLLHKVIKMKRHSVFL